MDGVDAIDPDMVGPHGALAYGRQENLIRVQHVDPLHPYYRRDILLGIKEGLTDDRGLEQLDLSFATNTAQLPDTWAVTVDILAFIRNACLDDCTEDQAKEIGRELCGFGWPKPKDLKFELPLVSGSSDAECRAMIQRIKKPVPVSFGGREVPLDQTDANQDQALEFTQSAHKLAKDLGGAAANEKVQIPKEIMAFVADSLSCGWTVEDSRRILEEAMPCREKRMDLHITPPASPKFQHGQEEAFVPSMEESQVQTPSLPASLLSDDLKAAEKELFDKESDICPQGSSTMADTSTTGSVPHSSPPGCPIGYSLPRRKKPEDYKFELPLVRDRKENPSPVILSFEDLFKPEQTSCTGEKTEIFEKEIHDKMEAAADDVNRLIEQEQLEPQDGLARLQAPKLDFSIPEPDWAGRATGSAKDMLEYIRSCHPEVFKFPRWHRDRRADRELPWVPSSTLGLISTDEKLEGDQHVLDRFLPDAGKDVPTSASFVTKKEGLLIMNMDEWDEYDEELLPAFARSASQPKDEPIKSQPADLMKCVRQKRKALEAEERTKGSDGERPPKRRKGSLNKSQNANGILLSDKHPASQKLLANFMEVNGHAKPKTTSSGNINHAPKNDGSSDNHRKISDTTKTCHAAREVSNLNQDTLEEAIAEAAAEQVVIAAPSPQINPPPFPLRLIISVALPRQMVKGLEALIPGVELIERDYGRHNYSVWVPGSSTPSTVASPMDSEADVAISARTGILLTSTVRVRQRGMSAATAAAATTTARVGGGATNMLQRRVQQASLRYERLVVLVSDGSLDDGVCAMSTADEVAFAELVAFSRGVCAASADGNTVDVFWVGGGQGALARWTASLACRFAGAEAGPFVHFLMQRETYWELFLRRTGMNVCAAQVVCGLLKGVCGDADGAGVDGQAESSSSSAGQEQSLRGPTAMGDLAAFVGMLPERRVECFGKVLGGRRVLDRVSIVLDQSFG